MSKICDECETVAHCTKHGCIPKVSAKDAMKLELEALEAMYDEGKRLGWHIHPKWSTGMDNAVKVITALREALAEQPAQQEPIYQYKLANGSWIDQTKESHDYNVRHGQATVRVVYTSPPAQRKPLTDEQAYKAIKEWCGQTEDDDEPSALDIFRAAEAAHGIKGDA